MDDIIKIVKAYEDSDLLGDGATETAKQEKKEEVKFPGAMMVPMVALYIAPTGFSLIQPFAS